MPAAETEIVISTDGREISRLVLRPGEYLIGRAEDAAIRVEANLVSRQHARLTIDHDHARVEDLGSSNGTFVNGQPVTGSTRIVPGQRVEVGSAIIELRRLDALLDTDMTLPPSEAVMRRLLPEEFAGKQRYEIGKRVAQGGMGAIIDAREITTERRVAMKVMLDPTQADDLVRFVAEAKVTAQLEHPNIVPVHELAVDGRGQVFYTMKFVRGVTLKKVLDLMAAGTKGTIEKYPLAALLTIFQKACDAVAFAHSKRVIHRDLKPENIMLGDFGEVLVMDWGLAKVLGAPASTAPAPNPMRSVVRTVPGASGSTQAGTIMGTPQYMAPEQARGEVDRLDARADIYALGAILYHLLALRPSVSGDDAMAIVEKVARGEVEDLCSVRSPSGAVALGQRTLHLPDGRIPDSLAAVVRKAMALDRDTRYASVAELQADITAYQGGFATRAEKAGLWKHFVLAIKRNKVASTAAALILALSAAFTAKVISEGRRAELVLAELRGTAPTFHAQARALVEEQKFDEALAKIDFALRLAPAEADYALFKANVLQATLRLAAARDAYRRALALRRDPAAEKNLALCEKLLRDNAARAELSRASVQELYEALLVQKRTGELATLAKQLGREAEAAAALLRKRLSVWEDHPKWSDPNIKSRAYGRTNGMLGVNLDKLPISDLSFLAGMPIEFLKLNATQVTDLAPLADLPLKTLEMENVRVRSLEFLRGRQIEELSIRNTDVADLSPLAGMPLRILSIAECRNITDLRWLRGMPLEELRTNGVVSVSDLTPLAGLRVSRLEMDNVKALADLSFLRSLPLETLRIASNGIRSLEPLRGMKLKELCLENCKQLTDFRPLADLPELKTLVLPATARDIESLRQHPKLERLSTRSFAEFNYEFLQVTPVKDFWAQWDGEGKQRNAILDPLRAALLSAGVKQSQVDAIKFGSEGKLEIDLSNSPLADLAPLRGLPIRKLSLNATQVRDLTPLQGLPLVELRLWNTLVSDLTPLRECRKLVFLQLNQTAVADLTPLAGLPLENLLIDGTKISGLTPLRGMPLRDLNLHRTGVTDVSPLAAFHKLESLTIPATAKGVEALRQLPMLKRMGFTYPVPPAPEFWKEFDAKKGAVPK